MQSFRLHERTVFTSATLSGVLHTDPASLPPRRDLLGLGPSPVLCSTWQWIAFPRDPTGALRARRHSCSDPGELGHLPARHCCLWGARRVGVGLPGARGSGPAATPVLSTDVCCSRMLFSKTIAPRLGARRIAMFPHDARACGFTPQCPLRRTVGSRSGCCLPQPPIRRRTSDASSLAGSPGRAMSTAVGPRSLARSQVETRKPRPTPPSRVNGFLGLALARSTFSLRSLRWIRCSARIGDPIRPLSRSRPFQDAISREANESFCRVTDPRGTTRASNPRDVAPRSFRNAASRAA